VGGGRGSRGRRRWWEEKRRETREQHGTRASAREGSTRKALKLALHSLPHSTFHADTIEASKQASERIDLEVILL